MKYAPNKVFILENGKYQELTYEEFCERKEKYSGRLFIPLHGTLLEVSAETYKEYYQDKRRQKYIRERSILRGDFSYDSLDTDEFHGEDILVDPRTDVSEEVERRISESQLRQAFVHLSNSERELIQSLYFEGMTERKYAIKKSIYHNAVHKRKQRILKKLKKYLEKFKN